MMSSDEAGTTFTCTLDEFATIVVDFSKAVTTTNDIDELDAEVDKINNQSKV